MAERIEDTALYKRAMREVEVRDQILDQLREEGVIGRIADQILAIGEAEMGKFDKSDKSEEGTYQRIAISNFNTALCAEVFVALATKQLCRHRDLKDAMSAPPELKNLSITTLPSVQASEIADRMAREFGLVGKP